MSHDPIIQPCAKCGALLQMPDADVLVKCPTCGAKMRAHARPAAKARAVARKPVVVAGGNETMQSWISILMIAALIGLGVGIYLYRDRLGITVMLGKGGGGSGEVAKSGKQVVADIDDLGLGYRVARMRLLDASGDSARDSAQDFRSFDTDRVKQPLRNWVTLHAALAHFLAGEDRMAFERCNRIVERGLFSKEPADQKLAAFFVETAKLATGDEPVRPDAAANLNRGNYEAFALLLFGAKDWALKQYDDASSFFDEFAKSTPSGEDAWIAEYRPIAASFATDRTEWRTASEAFAAAKDVPEKQPEALAAVQSARGKVTRGEFGRELEQMEAKLTESIAAREAGKKKMLSEKEVADAALIAELTQKTEPLCEQFRFAEARALVSGATVTSAKQKFPLQMLQKRMEWLARFKTDLAYDLTTIGYMGGLKKRDGKSLPGAVRKADDKNVEAGGSFGSIAVPWTDVSSDWIIDVAQTFIERTSQLDQKSNRQFDLGLYLLLLKRPQEARPWMDKAGQIKYEYQEAASMLLD